MAYSTPTLVRQALVPSSDGSVPESPTHTAADLTNQQLQDAIAEADALIDGYIGQRYAVPVTAVNNAIPHPLDYWSRNIAAYNATLVFRGSQDFSDTDPVARRYTATMDALKAVNAGKMALALPASGGTSTSNAGSALNPYEGDLFTPEDFDLDPSWSGVDNQGYMDFPYWRSR